MPSAQILLNFHSKGGTAMLTVEITVNIANVHGTKIFAA